LTNILCIIVLGCSGAGALNKDVSDCEDPVMMLCFANVALAIVHGGFALYLQSRLLTGLAKTGTAASSSKELMSQANHIMLYDIGFCLYVFVFFVSFGLNVVGLSWISDCSPSTPLPFIGALLLVLYAFGVVFFAVFWWFLMACDECCGGLFRPPPPRPTPVYAAAPARKRPAGLVGFMLGGLMPQQKQRGPQPAPQQMGMPMGVPVQVARPVATGYVVQQPGAAAPPPAAAPGAYGGGAGAPPPAAQPSLASQVAGGAAYTWSGSLCCWSGVAK
jgi:hypothetical protein